MVERNGTRLRHLPEQRVPRRPRFLPRRRQLGGRGGAARRRARPLGHARRSRLGLRRPPSPASARATAFALDADASVRGSRTGELIARCMVETGTSSYYTALAEATEEPVLQQICRLIAADEFRHFKLFYDHMRRYLEREQIGLPRRLRIAAGPHRRERGRRAGLRLPLRQRRRRRCRTTTTRCMAAYMGRAMAFYRFQPYRARHGHDLQGGRPAAARPAVRSSARLAWRLRAATASAASPAAAPRRPPPSVPIAATKRTHLSRRNTAFRTPDGKCRRAGTLALDFVFRFFAHGRDASARSER